MRPLKAKMNRAQPLSLLLIAALTAVLVPRAAPAESREFECNKTALRQGELNECAGERLGESNRLLNDTYSKLRDQISPEEKVALKKAQRAWIAYRDAQCNFNSMGVRTGTVYPMIYSYCLADLTNQQEKILEYQLNCEEGDLSCVHGR